MNNTHYLKRLAIGLSLAIVAVPLFWYAHPFNYTNPFTGVHVIVATVSDGDETEENEENDKYDGPDQASELEFLQTRDPATGTVPMERLVQADIMAVQSRNRLTTRSSAALLTWTERGPYSDVVGSGNGNKRANNAKTSGRIRATLVDLSDATGKTVWVGGVNGGLWKTTDITVAAPVWQLINDNYSNLAIASICQDPSNPSVMYFSTGEGYANADRARGVGVFKSINGGMSWNYLTNTSSYTNSTKILCDANGNVYLATNICGQGLVRSNNGGSTWTNITPSGSPSNISDLEINAAGRLHVCCGYFSSTGAYRFTDNPSTITSGSWTAPTTPFTYPTGSASRVEIACFGNTLYAAVSNAGSINNVHKSVDGGDTWSANLFPAARVTDLNGGTTGGQGWYCIGLEIDPSNTSNVIIGGLNCLKSTDGGLNWSVISAWVGTSGQYIHADVQNIKWVDNGNKLIVASDGGIFYSSDKGTTWRDRNEGLRIKQFYSCAIHPTTTDYFLAGAQDNGTHQLTSPGLSSSTEVTGGDGAFVAIDQDQPQYQFGAYVYNRYRRSTNGGVSWTEFDFGTSGSFINPWDYDNANNNIYAAYSPGSYLFWDNAPSTATSTSVTVAALGATSSAANTVSAVSVSPYTAHQVYLGTRSGRIVKVANANTASPTVTDFTAAIGVSGNVSCINTGTSDNNLIACFSNYGISRSILASSDGGTTWTNIDNSTLPDMPVWWVMFLPGDNTKAYAATETGVWETSLVNGTSTVWTANPSFPNTRATQLKFRASDRTLVASTHGRGLFTATIPGDVKLSAKVFLEGPYFSSASAGTSVLGQMNDFLRQLNLIPLSQPYTTANGFSSVGTGSGAETTTPSVLAVTGQNAIVDWVFLELRSSANSATVLATRSALLQRDGDVVDLDGVSPVGFSVSVGSYYVGIKHRNHLAIVSTNTLLLSYTSILADFTDVATSISASKMNIINGFKILRGGDLNNSGSITASDVFKARQANVAGQVDNYIIEDVNLTGKATASDIFLVRSNNKVN